MRKTYTQPLGEVLREYLNVFGLDKKLVEMRLIDSWPNAVGLAVANKTKGLQIKNRVLFVYLNSSIVRAELLAIRFDLPKRLNELAGANIIDEVVIR